MNYKTESTSATTAQVEDIWLNPPPHEAAALTRRILRAVIIENSKNERECLKIRFIHQRRHPQSFEWQDVDSFKLSTMKAGTEVNLQLDSAETFAVFTELERLFAIAGKGVLQGKHELQVVDPSKTLLVKGPAKEILESMLASAGDEVWTALKELNPYLFKATALVKLNEIREQAVHEFQKHLDANDWNEPSWQIFFEANTWIFGYGLNYRFLSMAQPQATYGGTNVQGSGAQRGDMLMMTAAQKRITVLVEIKTPATPLISPKQYRNGAFMISGEVAGGVSQVQANCRKWEMEGSKTEENTAIMDEFGALTIQPKGILIIGKSGDLKDRPRQTSFELFRRNVHNPEIITFDELLERARHLLLNEREQLTTAAPTAF
jgi:hypothetical protein